VDAVTLTKIDTWEVDGQVRYQKTG